MEKDSLTVNGEDEQATGDEIGGELILMAKTARRVSYIPEFTETECKLDVVCDDTADLKGPVLVCGRPPVENVDTASLSEDLNDEDVLHCATVGAVESSPFEDIKHIEEETLVSESVDRRASIQGISEILKDDKFIQSYSPIINGIPKVNNEENEVKELYASSGDKTAPLDDENSNADHQGDHSNLSNNDQPVQMENHNDPDVLAPLPSFTEETPTTTDCQSQQLNEDPIICTDASVANSFSPSVVHEVEKSEQDASNLPSETSEATKAAENGAEGNVKIVDTVESKDLDATQTKESDVASNKTPTTEVLITAKLPEVQSTLSTQGIETKTKTSPKSKSKGFLGVFRRSPHPKRQTVINSNVKSQTLPVEKSPQHINNDQKIELETSSKTNNKKSGFFKFGSTGKGKASKTQPSGKASSNGDTRAEYIKDDKTITVIQPVNTNAAVNKVEVDFAKTEAPKTSAIQDNSNVDIKTENCAGPNLSVCISHHGDSISDGSIKSGPEVHNSGVIDVQQVHNTSYSSTPEVNPSPSNTINTTNTEVQKSKDASISRYMVVVAIDFGTAFSGYAFSFVRDPESIHMMSKWEGGDPGVINQKTPTNLLLDPEGKFHSFGFTARNHYHDLSPEDSLKWLYFEKFKMSLYKSSDCNRQTLIEAANGQTFPAIEAVRMTLTYFKDHALQELSDQCGTQMMNDDVRWIVTVPAIWNASAKQFMRQAAYEAGLASAEDPEQLVIALEPEAASVHIRKLRLHMLVPDKPTAALPLTIKRRTLDPTTLETVSSQFKPVTRYMVVDCGGGTVDITVHDMNAVTGLLQEVYKASGGAHGSCGIDADFETLLRAIFGDDFITSYRQNRPAGWVALILAFESRKRAANPFKVHQPLNVALPFSFIDYHKKIKNMTVEKAISEFGEPELRWSSQGMLRMSPEAMKILFQTTVDGIIESVAAVFKKVNGIENIFLVGGLSESPIVQQAVRDRFSHQARIIVPQEANLAVLKGAVCYGLDPGVVAERRSRMTYGTSVLNRFIPGKHPQSKLVHKDGVDWCKDVFDQFVVANQIVCIEEPVVRTYTPASSNQSHIKINIYSTDHTDVQFVTDDRITQCATITLDLTRNGTSYGPSRRKILTYMTFAETEIKVTALDTTNGEKVYAAIDFPST